MQISFLYGFSMCLFVRLFWGWVSHWQRHLPLPLAELTSETPDLRATPQPSVLELRVHAIMLSCMLMLRVPSQALMLAQRILYPLSHLSSPNSLSYISKKQWEMFSSWQVLKLWTIHSFATTVANPHISAPLDLLDQKTEDGKAELKTLTCPVPHTWYLMVTCLPDCTKNLICAQRTFRSKPITVSNFSFQCLTL